MVQGYSNRLPDRKEAEKNIEAGLSLIEELEHKKMLKGLIETSGQVCYPRQDGLKKKRLQTRVGKVESLAFELKKATGNGE